MAVLYGMTVSGVLGDFTREGVLVGGIRLLSAEWGHGRMQTDPNTGLPIGKVAPRLVHVTKSFDRSSAQLGPLAISRAPLEIAIYQVTSSSAGNNYFMDLQLRNAVIESITGSDASGGDYEERLAISYSDLTMTYAKALPDGRRGELRQYQYTPVF
jgi:type VI secretion system Hcp family effector